MKNFQGIATNADKIYVQKNLEKKVQNTIAEEQQIELMVYKLYELTYDEVLIVDPKTPLAREEYDAFDL